MAGWKDFAERLTHIVLLKETKPVSVYVNLFFLCCYVNKETSKNKSNDQVTARFVVTSPYRCYLECADRLSNRMVICPSPKKRKLGILPFCSMTRNWSSGDLRIVSYLFIAITPSSTLTRGGSICLVTFQFK